MRTRRYLFNVWIDAKDEKDAYKKFHKDDFADSILKDYGPLSDD